jgi:hypothetical protein
MHCLWIVALVFALSGSSYAEGRVFDWIKASDEDAQLDPADFHAGRVYRPGPDGGNLHVDIQSSLPVTIAMANAEAWNDIQQHPVNLANLSYSCIRDARRQHNLRVPPGAEYAHGDPGPR